MNDFLKYTTLNYNNKIKKTIKLNIMNNKEKWDITRWDQLSIINITSLSKITNTVKLIVN